MYIVAFMGAPQYTMLILGPLVFTQMGSISDRDVATVYTVFTYLLLLYISIITMPSTDT